MSETMKPLIPKEKEIRERDVWQQVSSLQQPTLPYLPRASNFSENVQFFVHKNPFYTRPLLPLLSQQNPSYAFCGKTGFIHKIIKRRYTDAISLWLPEAN